jgi:alkylation response protein AidB-like acyl-CoA dehydrogenase
MDFGLTDDQREIQRTARELLTSRATPERVREHAEAARVDDELWREIAGLGWPGIAVAERYDGQGMGAIELAILCEELGRSLAPVPLVPTLLAATLIEHAGSDEQRERWLPGLASGELTGAVGDARDGVAALVPGGDGADVVVIVEDGAAWVAAAADAQLEPVASIDSTRPAARASIEGAEPLSGAAGGPAAGSLAAALDRAATAVAAELVGVCDRALEMTVAYVKERRQFGTPVGAYQAVSHRCAQMLLDTESARAAVSFAAWAADADAERLPEAAAMAKAAASDAGREVTAAAIQLHGGIGFTWEADVHWLYKRAQLDAVLLGGPRHHRARLARIAAARPDAAAMPA